MPSPQLHSHMHTSPHNTHIHKRGCRVSQSLAPAARREFLFVLLRAFTYFSFFCFLIFLLSLFLYVCVCIFLFVPSSPLVRAQVSSTSPFRAVQSVSRSRRPPRVSLCSPFTSFSLFCFRFRIFVSAFFYLFPFSPLLVRAQVSYTSSPFRATQSVSRSRHPPRVSLRSPFGSSVSLFCFRFSIFVSAFFVCSPSPPCPHAVLFYLLAPRSARPNLLLPPTSRREFLFVLCLLRALVLSRFVGLVA